MAQRDVVGNQPVPVLRERPPTGEDQTPAGLQRAADVAKSRHRVGEEHDAHARSREIEAGRLEREHLGVAEQQGDVAQPTLIDPTARGAEHRLGDVDRDDPALLADRGGERQGQGAGAAADFEHALAAGDAEARQQHGEALLVAPLPEPRAGNPARPGNGVPIAALRRVCVESFPGHLQDPPISARIAAILARRGLDCLIRSGRGPRRIRD